MINNFEITQNCRRNLHIIVQLKKENPLIPQILDFLHYEVPHVASSGFYLDYINTNATQFQMIDEIHDINRQNYIKTNYLEPFSILNICSIKPFFEFQAQYVLDNKAQIIEKYEEINQHSGTSIDTPKESEFYQKNIKIIKQIEPPKNYIFGGIIKPIQQNTSGASSLTTDDVQLFSSNLDKIDTYSVINRQLLMIHNLKQIPVDKIQFFYKLKSNLFQNDCNTSIFNNLPKYIIDEHPEIIFNVCTSDAYNHKTQKKNIQKYILQLMQLAQEMIITKYRQMQQQISKGVIEYIQKQKNNEIIIYCEDQQVKIAFFKQQNKKLLMYILDMLKQVYQSQVYINIDKIIINKAVNFENIQKHLQGIFENLIKEISNIKF